MLTGPVRGAVQGEVGVYKTEKEDQPLPGTKVGR